MTQRLKILDSRFETGDLEFEHHAEIGKRTGTQERRNDEPETGAGLDELLVCLLAGRVSCQGGNSLFLVAGEGGDWTMELSEMTSTPKLGKGLGRRKDAEDKRDLRVPLDLSHLGIGAPLPSSADVFVGLNLPIYDQGSLRSCTANAGVLYRRFLAQRFSKYSAPDEDLSRLFLYYQERKLPWNNDVAADSGACIRDVCYVLAHTGVCSASVDPYIPEDFASANDNDAAVVVDSARRYEIGAYHRILDVVTVKQCLASGYAVLLGFTVYASFEEIDDDGFMPMPQVGDPVIGGHAVVIRGYNNNLKRFKVQNSWGDGWGDHGSFWMPYAFLEDAALSEPDMWMMHLGKPWKQ